MDDDILNDVHGDNEIHKSDPRSQVIKQILEHPDKMESLVQVMSGSLAEKRRSSVRDSINQMIKDAHADLDVAELTCRQKKENHDEQFRIKQEEMDHVRVRVSNIEQQRLEAEAQKKIYEAEHQKSVEELNFVKERCSRRRNGFLSWKTKIENDLKSVVSVLKSSKCESTATELLSLQWAKCKKKKKLSFRPRHHSNKNHHSVLESKKGHRVVGKKKVRPILHRDYVQLGRLHRRSPISRVIRPHIDVEFLPSSSHRKNVTPLELLTRELHEMAEKSEDLAIHVSQLQSLPMYDNDDENRCVIGSLPDGTCSHFLSKMLALHEELQSDLLRGSYEEVEEEKQCEQSMEKLQKFIQISQNAIGNFDIAFLKAVAAASEAQQMYKVTNQSWKRMRKEMRNDLRSCKSEVRKHDSNICALRKLRDEFLSTRPDAEDGPALVVDCVVGPWVAGECSASCGGGVKTLTREVISQNTDVGAHCPSLKVSLDCNTNPCPLHCVSGGWEDWSECTAMCGGGIRTRMMKILKLPENGGKGCEETTQMEKCHTQSCNADCVLGEWSDFGQCSRQCGGGAKTRERGVAMMQTGTGVCPPPHESVSHTIPCNWDPCKPELKCSSNLDLVVLLESSGDQTEEENKLLNKIAAKIVSAFKPKGGEESDMKKKAFSRIGFVNFGGPRTLHELNDCESRNDSQGEAACRADVVQPLSQDFTDLNDKMKSLMWMKGGANVASAIARAESLFENANLTGSENEKEEENEGIRNRVILLITGNAPMNEFQTTEIVRNARKHARFAVVAVGPSKQMQTFYQHVVSRPIQQNLLLQSDLHYFDEENNLDAFSYEIMTYFCENLE